MLYTRFVVICINFYLQESPRHLVELSLTFSGFPHLLESLEKYSKPGKIMEFCKKIIKIMEIWNFVSLEMWEPWDTVEMIYF